MPLVHITRKFWTGWGYSDQEKRLEVESRKGNFGWRYGEIKGVGLAINKS